MARIGIKDIAARAGVSPATVSRVLNNRAGTMTEATRQRVQRVIEETGYRPSNAARSLRLDKSETLGVILADIRNPFSSAMLEALTSQAAGRGYSMMTAISGNDPAIEAEAVRRLTASGVDGLIINTSGGAESTLSTIAPRIPAVLLDRDIPHSNLPLVTSNNVDLVSGLVAEIVRAGCTSCYLLDENDDTSSIRRERGDAFRRELERRKLVGSVVPLSTVTSGAVQTVRQLMELSAATGERPGLVAINGLVFLRLVEALGLAGVTVPGDACVATFDEYAWNRVLFGGITSAVQNTAGITTAILDLLIETMRTGVPSARRTEIPGTIIPRASTRPA